MQDIPCVFCFDGAFAEKAAVAIASLLIHADSRYRLYCLVSGVTAEHIAPIERLARRHGTRADFIDVAGRFGDWKVRGDYSPANYYRLLIPDAVPEARVIYLDCDLLVTCDLAPLFATGLGGAWLAARVDREAGRDSRVPRPADEPYVNSGVLLLDLDRLRAERFLDRARDAYEAHVDGIDWADQCVINKAAEGRKMLLEQRWNVMAHEKDGAPSVQARLEPYDGRGILHFSGRIKPWHAWSGRWEAGLWQSYERLAGVPRREPRAPVTVTEWQDYAGKLEDDGAWQEAAAAHRRLAEHFERQLRKERRIARDRG